MVGPADDIRPRRTRRELVAKPVRAAHHQARKDEADRGGAAATEQGRDGHERPTGDASSTPVFIVFLNIGGPILSSIVV